jgi:hypothetical protein
MRDIVPIPQRGSLTWINPLRPCASVVPWCNVEATYALEATWAFVSGLSFGARVLDQRADVLRHQRGQKKGSVRI